MSVNAAILPNKIDVSKLKYSEPKLLDNQSKTVYVNYDGDRLTVQTPLMNIPYNITDYNQENDKYKKYDLNVSFAGMDSNPKMKQFFDKVVEIEEKIKADAFKNRQLWLRDDYDGIKKVVDKLFFPIIRYDKDKDTGKVLNRYPPTMKVKLPYDTNGKSFMFDAYDMDNNEITFAEHMGRLKGAKARLIIQLTGIWIAGGKYGCTWKVVRGKFQMQSKNTYSFVEDSDDEDCANDNVSEQDEELVAEALANAKVNDKKKSKAAVLPDTDEEDDEDDSEIDEPVPPPPPVKKTVKKSVKK
ncbi:hypothetical protein [Dishui Lake large algae virus 1]|nr:hypothetical protein [Dishui Lake large algae virus 1]